MWVSISMAYIAFPVLNIPTQCTNCYCDKNMADLSNQRHWSCDDCDEVSQRKCCSCNCPCHASTGYNQADTTISNTIDESIEGQNPVEERMDMFEWMARQRLKEVHAKRESIIHEYVTREPLQPEVIQTPVPSKISDSRNYLNAIQIVQNMKAKWEAMTDARNPPIVPLPPSKRRTHNMRHVDMFQGVLSAAKKTLNMSKHKETPYPNVNRCSEKQLETNTTQKQNTTVVQNCGPPIQFEDNGTQTSVGSTDSTYHYPQEIETERYHRSRKSLVNIVSTQTDEEVVYESRKNSFPDELEEPDATNSFSTALQFDSAESNNYQTQTDIEQSENSSEPVENHRQILRSYSRNHELETSLSNAYDDAALKSPSELHVPEDPKEMTNYEQIGNHINEDIQAMIDEAFDTTDEPKIHNFILHSEPQLPAPIKDQERRLTSCKEVYENENILLKCKDDLLQNPKIQLQNHGQGKLQNVEVQDQLQNHKLEITTNKKLPINDVSLKSEIRVENAEQDNFQNFESIEHQQGNQLETKSNQEPIIPPNYSPNPETPSKHELEEFQNFELKKHWHRHNLEVNVSKDISVPLDFLQNQEIRIENPEKEEFQNFELKKHKHRPSLRTNVRDSLIPHQSLEGLLPIRLHSPERPKLPEPMHSTGTEGSNISIKSQEMPKKQSPKPQNDEQNLPWYIGWFSSVHTEDKDEDSVQENGQIHKSSTEETSLTASSIALDIEGHAARRATILEDERLLNMLSADYDETVITDNDSQVVAVHKSKSHENISTEELKMVAKSLSEERMRTSNDSSQENKYNREFHICHKCKKIVKPGDATFQFQNGYQSVWHRKCFVCSECDKQLGLMDHLFFEEKPYCYDHYVVVAHVPKCHGCNDFIFDPSYTSAVGHFWHREHFICTRCHKALVDTKYVLVHGIVYCFSCHQKDFIRVCKSCTKTILPHETYVQSGDYFWHSNDSCLHCETCKRSLVGRSFFFRKAGHLYCNRYCALGRGPPV